MNVFKMWIGDDVKRAVTIITTKPALCLKYLEKAHTTHTQETRSHLKKTSSNTLHDGLCYFILFGPFRRTFLHNCHVLYNYLTITLLVAGRPCAIFWHGSPCEHTHIQLTLNCTSPVLIFHVSSLNWLLAAVVTGCCGQEVRLWFISDPTAVAW